MDVPFLGVTSIIIAQKEFIFIILISYLKLCLLLHRTNVVKVQPMNESTEFTQTETTRKRNGWTNSDQNMENDA